MIGRLSMGHRGRSLKKVTGRSYAYLCGYLINVLGYVDYPFADPVAVAA